MTANEDQFPSESAPQGRTLRPANPETMLARYRAHNTEVRAYFRKRWFDLLEMDMSRGAGWPELCRFLGCERPDVEYPRAYSAY